VLPNVQRGEDLVEVVRAAIAVDRHRAGVRLGFGRIFVSETEAPNLSAKLA
jgi:hypothetical protein